MPFSGWYGVGFGLGADAADGAAGLSDDALGLLILSILEEGPAPGYEVALALEERSGGGVPADPELVYPLLQLLLDREMISVRAVAEEEGRDEKKIYELTDRGRERIERRRRRIEALWRRARIGHGAAWDEEAFEVAMGCACGSVHTALREVGRVVDRVVEEVLGCGEDSTSSRRGRGRRRRNSRCC